MRPLFHYTSCEKLELISRNKQLRFTHIRDLNDVDEWIVGARFFCEQARAINTDRMNGLAEGFELIIEGERPLPWFVASFSLQPEIRSQWERYADNHKGVCIAFDPNRLVSNGVSMLEVHYGQKNWASLLKTLLDDIEKLPTDDSHTIAIGAVCHFAAQCKADKWSTEEEVRLFGFVPDPDFSTDPILRRRIESMQGSDESGRKFTLLPIELEAITNVTVGESGDVRSVKRILGESGFSHVEVRKG